MIICQCKVVSDQSVARAVDSGARTLSQVCRITGAGRVCGSCVFSVKRLLNERRSKASYLRLDGYQSARYER
jgi:bacterioferritin-associated ferredoxin